MIPARGVTGTLGSGRPLPAASTAPRPLQLFVCGPSLRLPLAEPRSPRAPAAPAPALPWESSPRRRILGRLPPLSRLARAVQPPHTVRPCPTGAAHASQQLSPAQQLETRGLQTSAELSARLS